jgi:hypothetical protein
MIKYQEPEVVDPRTLEPGDQIGCSDAGLTLYPIIGEVHNEDPIWMTLANAPGETVGVPEFGRHRPLPKGNTALDLAGHGWLWGVLPQVLARRVIR